MRLPRRYAAQPHLPERAGAGGVAGIDAAQQAQGVERRLEQLGLQVRPLASRRKASAESSGSPPAAHHLQEVPVGVGEQVPAHRRRQERPAAADPGGLGRREGALPGERRPVSGRAGRGSFEMEQAVERLLPAVGGGQGPGSQQVPLEVPIAGRQPGQGVERRLDLIRREQGLGPPVQLGGGQQAAVAGPSRPREPGP